jgi:peptidoglycan/LPS O-acetylase OafA/YrhL
MATTSMDSITWKNPRLAGRLPELDGIRGLAILLVLVWHYFSVVRGIALGSWQAYLVATLRLTWSGVDLFFVLSGFLIGGILYDARDSRSYYQTFYGRRIFRIFPLYFAWMALFFAGLYCVGPGSTNTLRAIFNRDIPVWSYPLFLQNFSMAWNQTTFGATWMGATWSLAVEEQFYFLLPSLMRHLSYRGITWMATASILCAPLVRLILTLSGNHYFGPYTLLPCRADALGFGVLIALACRNKRAWEWLASHRRDLYAAFLVLACGVGLLMKYEKPLYIVGLTWIAAFYASLLLLTVVNPGRIETSLFRSQILMKLGTVAYAVYILHQGINALFHYAIFGREPGISGWSSLAVTVLSLITVILLSALSWKIFEKPLIRHAHAAYRY